MPFKKGHKKLAGKKKGTRHKTTLLKIELGEKIKDLDSALYDNIKEFLFSTDKYTKAIITKELLKYRLPQKKEIDNRHSGTILFQANPKIINNG